MSRARRRACIDRDLGKLDVSKIYPCPDQFSRAYAWFRCVHTQV